MYDMKLKSTNQFNYESANEFTSAFKPIEHLIETLRRRWLWISFLRILLLWLASLIIGTVLLFVLAGLFLENFSTLRWVIILLWFSIFFSGPTVFLYTVIFSQPNELSLALTAEKKSNLEHNYIINAITLTYDTHWPRSIVKRIVSESVKHLSYIDPRKVFPTAYLKIPTIIVMLATIISILTMLIGHDLVLAGIRNIKTPPTTLKPFSPTPKFQNILNNIPIRITLNFPTYTQLPPKTLDKLTPLTLPEGTSIEFSIPAISNIKEAFILQEDGRKSAFIKPQNTRYYAKLQVNQTTAYCLVFKSSEKLYQLPRDGSFIPIKIIPDNPPTVKIISPKNISAKPADTVKITAEAKDDYGLTQLEVLVKLPTGKIQKIKSRTPTRKSSLLIAHYTIPPELKPKDTIEYWAEAIDNRSLPNKCPQKTTSNKYTIKIISSQSSTDKQSSLKSEQDSLKLDDKTAELKSVKPNQANDKFKMQEFTENLKDLLGKFIDQQKLAIKSLSSLTSKTPEDFSENDLLKLNELKELKEQWEKFFEQAVNDLNKLKSQDFSATVFRDELIEIQSQIELAKNGIDQRSIHQAIKADQVALELAEELTHNLERWLANKQDNTKWDLEEPPSPIDVPLAELPEELTDIIGDLIEQEEDFYDQIEDVTSSWADSLDKGAGWDVADGPISNYSAKGITGNLLPNANEIAGRSGEGRTGRSSGEFVENTATGKGGRRTPTRLTNDAYQPGQIEDTDPNAPGGATGGGKVSGRGAEGLPGNLPKDLIPDLPSITEKQAIILAKTKILYSHAIRKNWPIGNLRKIIEMMNKNIADLKNHDYGAVIKRRKTIIQGLDKTKDSIAQKYKLETEKRNFSNFDYAIPSDMIETLPRNYRTIVERYYHLLDIRQ